jgi:crotonobetainyl-CoA:carnitine CoA-transferase CaiB-like acyl-CoA transferase
MQMGGERHIPFPVRVDGARGAALRNASPSVGEHTVAVLSEIGFASTEIEALTNSGLFAPQGATKEAT